MFGDSFFTFLPKNCYFWKYDRKCGTFTINSTVIFLFETYRVEHLDVPKFFQPGSHRHL